MVTSNALPKEKGQWEQEDGLFPGEFKSNNKIDLKLNCCCYYQAPVNLNNVHDKILFPAEANLSIIPIFGVPVKISIWKRHVQVSPDFQKLAFCHFDFTKDLPQDLFSLKERNLKRIFAFTKKATIALSICFAASVLERQCTSRAARVAPPSSLPRNNTQHPHQAATALNCLCEHLALLISIYFVPPLARCVLSSLLFCFMPFWLSSRNTLLSRNT